MAQQCRNTEEGDHLMDIANETHWDSRQQWRLWKAALLICIILLLSSLLPFTNAIAAPPSDDPEPGEIRLGVQDNEKVQGKRKNE